MSRRARHGRVEAEHMHHQLASGTLVIAGADGRGMQEREGRVGWSSGQRAGGAEHERLDVTVEDAGDLAHLRRERG